LIMVRISESGSSDGIQAIRLEGRVVGPCVAEVQTYCQRILSQGLTLTIDMAEVSFLDRKGVGLFRELIAQEVRLLNCSPFLNELLKPVAL
jgi:anti-anti-sigma regulatory factor